MKKIVAISLAVLFLFVNMGFTIATHKCHGHVVKAQLMLGNTNLDCGMARMNKSCHQSSTKSVIKRKKCCEIAL